MRKLLTVMKVSTHLAKHQVQRRRCTCTGGRIQSPSPPLLRHQHQHRCLPRIPEVEKVDATKAAWKLQEAMQSQ